MGWSKVRDNIGRRLKAELELPSMPERIPTNRRGMTARPQCLISANSISSRVYCHLIPRASRCPLCARVCVAHPFVNDGPKTPRIVSRILVENPSNSNLLLRFFEREVFRGEIKADVKQSVAILSIFLKDLWKEIRKFPVVTQVLRTQVSWDFSTFEYARIGKAV